MTNGHPTLDELVELAQREDPSAGDGAATLAHVRSCPECEELFVPMRLLVVGARSQRRTRRRWTLALAGAAGGALVVVLALVALPSIRSTGGAAPPGADSPDSASPTAEAAVPVPEGPPAAEAGTPDPPAEAGTPDPPAEAGTSDSPAEPGGPPDAADPDPSSLADPGPIPGRLVEFRLRLLTGTPVSGDTYRYDLRRGWEALGDADHDTAMEVFETMLRQRPSDMEVAGMFGVAAYLAGDDSERTRALLERGTEQEGPGMRQRLATWYLANLHLRRGEVDRAIATLESLRFEDGLSDLMSRRADALLARIAALQEEATPPPLTAETSSRSPTEDPPAESSTARQSNRWAPPTGPGRVYHDGALPLDFLDICL